jgi:hypothetical protein
MHTPSPNLLAGFCVAASAALGARGVRRGGVLASSVLASAAAAQPVSLPHVRRGVTGGGLLGRFVRGGGPAGALSCRSLPGCRVRGRLRSSGRSRANPAVERTCAKSRAGRSLLR